LERWWSTFGVVADTELRATNFDGSDRWFGIRAANLSNDPVVGGMVINMRDITDRKRAEEELSHNVFHDSLTGLANRALFHDRLEHALERTSRSGWEVAVVYLDLDGFKTINDSRGHEAGDQVLREMAARLLGIIRSIDTLSRLGGDEFAILVEESARALDEAQAVAERVLELLTDPFVVHNHQVVLSASIGIAIGDVASDASGMMRDADLAMYKAKTSGRARWAVYEPSLSVAALQRLELESDLRRALQRNQFRILYQPIVQLKSNRVAGFEALLRWDHPRLGVVGPNTFIPIAENNGTIVEIGQWVLEGACRTAAEWRRAHPDLEQSMAVNLSGRQLATSEIVGQVAKALAQSGLPASSLVLEITEGVLVQDADIAAQRLEQLRSLGVRLAIDDFGTGYSSLSYLRQFPIDILKIDRSFTQTIADQSPMPAIVRGLLDLAKTLGLETVAEGIEFEAQQGSLRDANCDFGQGLLFAGPLGFTEATALLADLRTMEPGSHLEGLTRSASHRMAEELLG
jgi:diguanylate cyclase (GGDEF)-like protein